MSADSGRPFLFLSYASSEREGALEIAASLERAGISVWIDRTGISAGSLWTAVGRVDNRQ